MVGTRLVWNRLPDEVRSEIRRRVVAGARAEDVALVLGVSERSVFRIVAQAGGMPPRWDTRSSSRLSLRDREEIALGLERRDTFKSIACIVGCDPSTVGREVARNGGRDGYRAWRADQHTHRRAARPKPEKLALNKPLALAVEYMLEQHCSRSRSREDCRWSSPTTRTCACHTKRSINRYSFTAAARFAKSS